MMAPIPANRTDAVIDRAVVGDRRANFNWTEWDGHTV